MATSILTSYGEQIITDAIASGTTISIDTFIVSSSIVELTPSLETLPNIVMTSSNPSKLSIVKVANNTVEFRIYLDTQDGNFDIGTLGILDSNDRLVAAGSLDEIIHKVATSSSQQGNTLQFKIPVNLSSISQVIESTGQQFIVDNSTILIDSDGVISCGVVPHHVFDIFQNASTANPPGALPMWTGELVYCEGSHEEFYDKAIELFNTDKIRVINQATYDAEVSEKGWTNGFVIDTTNKTIRLPKFKGILYLNDPAVQDTNLIASSSSGTYGFIALPTYIQVDTAAVPATIAQCNAFLESLRTLDNLVVHKAGTETITGLKEFSVSPTVPTPTSGSNDQKVVNTAYVKSVADTKQDTLVNTVNIKSVNGKSILGSGDLSVNTRNIGEIIMSTIPLNDAGLHLLDGAIINGSGIYGEFVTHIASLVSSYPNAFTTEALWQSSVSNYGVCGKFVYDSVNNTIRLPKITGFVEGTTDPIALGELVQAGLPNITGSFNGSQLYDTDAGGGSVSAPSADGAFQVGGSDANLTPNNTGDYSQNGFSFDASRSSTIYGNSNTVQPQSIKVLYYIVTANSTKTDIEVDIDEIVTDLNGKVDKNELQTVYPIVETYSNGAAGGYRLWSDGYCEQWGVARSSTTTATINLLVPYNGMDFICNADDGGAAAFSMGIDRTSSSTITITSSGADFAAFWNTRGYIAQGN